MRFKEIIYENYRCFINGKLEFPKINGKNMTVLIAPNGGGKTETLFSFWWTLYDYDFSKLTNKENTPYALNSELYRKLENSSVGSKESCKVILRFESENTLYEVTKVSTYTKETNRIDVSERRSIAYYKENGELSLPITDPKEVDKVLNRIIPRSILYGIIFDGERMQKLNNSDENTINAIKGVINDITNVELIEKCKNYFESIYRKIAKQLDDIAEKSGDLSIPELTSNINKLTSNLDDSKAKKEAMSDEYDKNEFRISDISKKLEANDIVKSLQEERKETDSELKHNEDFLDEYYKNFFDLSCKFYYMSTDKLLVDVDNLIINYDVPDELRAEAITYILNSASQECICGRHLDEKSIDTLKKLRDKLPPDNLNTTFKDYIRHTKEDHNNIKKESSNVWKKINATNKNISKLKEHISYLGTRIQEIAVNASDDEALALESERIRLSDRQKAIKDEIPNLTASINEMETQLRKLKKQLEHKQTSFELHDDLFKRLGFVDKSISALNIIQNVNKDNALSVINVKLAEAYEKLSEDYDRGRKIRIIQYDAQHKYQMAVYMESNCNKQISEWKANGEYNRLISKGLSDDQIYEKAVVGCMDSNSTGQSKINTFAFVKAILDYSNEPKKSDGIEVRKDYPLLIDAPFGDISAGNLIKSSSELHNFANQVILMIDEDKYEALKDNFDPYTNAQYFFNKTSEENNSTIEKRVM